MAKISVRTITDEITAALRRSPVVVPAVRSVRRDFTRRLRPLQPRIVRDVALLLNQNGDWPSRFVACELVAHHSGALDTFSKSRLMQLGADLQDWCTTDMFGVTLAGQAWRDGILTDKMIMSWTRSPDRWRRRLALVATVPLNIKSRGGSGDTKRTLAICKALIDDRDDMVVKALSWALRELSKCDPKAVRLFVKTYRDRLAGRVVRETVAKLKTGLKNPKLKQQNT